MKLKKIQFVFYSCLSILIALIDKTPLLLDERTGTKYIENGFYTLYSGILNNTMEAPYPYRFLIVRCIDCISDFLNMAPITIAFYLNMIFIFILLTLFNRFAGTFLAPFNSFLTTLFLAFYIMIMQSQFIGIIIVETQDIANAVFFTALLIVGINKKWLWFGLIMVLSIMNRETTLILLLPFGYILLKDKKYKSLAWICFSGIATYVAIRLLLKVNQGDYPNFANLKTNFPGLDGTVFTKAIEYNVHLFVTLFPIVVVAFYNLNSKNQLTKAIVLTTIPFIIIHYIMGSIIELRLFFPLIILLLPIAIFNLKTLFEAP